jgi:hypothetical protein
MEGKEINTVEELINFLKQYPLDTEIFHLTGDKKTMKESHGLYVLETHPIGDRDTEEIITLSFANNSDPFNY